MANIFTSNQVNHVYVVKGDFSAATKPTKASPKGTTYLGHNTVDNAIYFMQRGAAGLVRTDLIDVDKIMYVKYTPASKMERKKNAVKITLNTAATTGSGNSTYVIGGQDYILRLTFQNPIGMSPDHEYWKHGVVHATSTMTPSQFYAKMAQSLVGNFSRDAVKLLNVYLTTSGSDVEVTSASQTLSSTYTGIKLVEAPQDWILGVKQDKPIIFKVNTSTITKTINNVPTEITWEDLHYSDGRKYVGGEDITASTDTANVPTGGTVKNGHLAAELEYFSMGERADLYRNVGWPDTRNTEYLVDETLEYDMIGIHYYYIGSNHAIQRSEKDLTLLVPRTSSDTGTGLGSKASSIKTALENILNPLDDRYEPATP
jgi:hypothetical protein